MSLTPEQKQAVAAWVAAGDNLSAVQKKLSEQFKISMTYRDVRFLVDDLGLELKNAAPKTDASDVSKAAIAKPALAAAGEVEHADPSALAEDDFPAQEGVPAVPPPAGPGTFSLEIDRIMRPGTMVSGAVTFSDGVTGKWALDQQGRLMLETAQKGYQPGPADVQAFQRELQTQLQRQGY